VIRVVVADDHAIVRRGICGILADVTGVNVVGEASTGEEALALVRQARPHLAILDLSMPGRGGLEAIEAILREPTPPKVLVVTVHPETQFAIRTLQAGAAGYLTKDSAPEELGEPMLLRVIDYAIERRSLEVREDRVLAELDAHHAVLGSAVLRRWGMRPDLSELARHHHADKPAEALSAAHQALAPRLYLMGLARHVVASTPYATWVGDLGDGPPRSACREALGLSKTDLRDAQQRLEADVASGGLED